MKGIKCKLKALEKPSPQRLMKEKFSQNCQLELDYPLTKHPLFFTSQKVGWLHQSWLRRETFEWHEKSSSMLEDGFGWIIFERRIKKCYRLIGRCFFSIAFKKYERQVKIISGENTSLYQSISGSLYFLSHNPFLGHTALGIEHCHSQSLLLP